MAKSTPVPPLNLTSEQVRQRLVDALELDLIGPRPDSPLAEEVLPQPPSRWYLAGFLVPTSHTTPELDADDNPDMLGATAGAGDDDDTPERPSGEAKLFPSSMGLSLLVPPQTRTLTVEAFWADYLPLSAPAQGEFAPGQDQPAPTGQLPGQEKAAFGWKRTQHQHTFESVPLPTRPKPEAIPLPGSRGLKLVLLVRPLHRRNRLDSVPEGTRVVSVFLVNERDIALESEKDQSFAFQVKLRVHCAEGLVPRPNARGTGSQEADERISDLQYRDSMEFATGHGISTEARVDETGRCHEVETRWLPTALVNKIDAARIEGVELRMEALAQSESAPKLQQVLTPLITQYQAWLEKQKSPPDPLTPPRKKTLEELVRGAQRIARRMEQGIASLRDPRVLEAFQLANRAMAIAARQRMGRIRNCDPATVEAPAWRPFQLAFILMNLPAMADPTHDDREVVDLLFFPTGGGKTEAYLGLAAFTLLLRRLKHKDYDYAGVSVLMRYTLRLLTLDQLGRAAMLICALEILRKENLEKLGRWPFEIGLWVGMAATPNVMGKSGDNNPDSARERTNAYKRGTRSSSPIPLEECPWCGRKFEKDSFVLRPNYDNPTNLFIYCLNEKCAFHSSQTGLPIVAVDEPIYRRLPCFIISTVDKFAAMPWTGQVGALFGRVDRVGPDGFYGPTDPPGTQQALPNNLPPPDLIIQDELHLVSGPMGTMVGLYETALENLCVREVEGRPIRPKIIASTATVRRATEQIRALFDRPEVDIFPAPGPNRRDSFFALEVPPEKVPARLYLGVAAQGVSLKKLLLRTYLTLLSTGQKCWEECGGAANEANPADPYMTLVGYFNSLRELGSSRRIIEDEVTSMLGSYGRRKRVGQVEALFANRKILDEVTELTSRENTGKVAQTKERLTKSFSQEGRIDVVVATNMISVGLDITRLGLMVVCGQPKASAEYIQATSRVGRDPAKPGLVVTLLNVHRHRDRSHYERFRYYHETFYRSVEATSVTPFSPRALDRGLAGAVLGLARLGHAPMTRPLGASEILRQRGQLQFVVEAFAKRAQAQHVPGFRTPQEMADWIRGRVDNLLDEWTRIVNENMTHNTRTQYQIEEGNAARFLYEFLHQDLVKKGAKYPFRANRSMRDVEPAVDIWVRAFDDRSPTGGNA